MGGVGGQVLMGEASCALDTALALGQGEPLLVQPNLAVFSRFKFSRKGNSVRPEKPHILICLMLLQLNFTANTVVYSVSYRKWKEDESYPLKIHEPLYRISLVS